MDFILSLPPDGDSIMTDIALDVATESFYDIYDHGTPDRLNPLPSVCINKGITTNNNVRAAYRKIMNLGLPKLTNMSADDLLNLPPDEFMMIQEEAAKIEKELNETIDRAAPPKTK